MGGEDGGQEPTPPAGAGMKGGGCAVTLDIQKQCAIRGGATDRVDTTVGDKPDIRGQQSCRRVSVTVFARDEECASGIRETMETVFLIAEKYPGGIYAGRVEDEYGGRITVDAGFFERGYDGNLDRSERSAEITGEMDMPWGINRHMHALWLKDGNLFRHITGKGSMENRRTRCDNDVAEKQPLNLFRGLPSI